MEQPSNPATLLPILCPSFRCVPGARLIGIIQADGRATLTEHAIEIDDGFINRANEGREPERRFRFAGACVQAACTHWERNGCELVRKVVTILSPQPPGELPVCSIRHQCRWYMQAGAVACAACPEVITHRVFPDKIH